MRLELRRLGLLATLAAASLSLQPAHAALFEDEEARRAILELRQRVDAQRVQAEAQKGLLDAQKALIDHLKRMVGAR